MSRKETSGSCFMKKSFITKFFFTIAAGIFLLHLSAAPALVFAANDPYGLQATRNESQYKDSKKSVPELVGSVISVALSLIGFVFLGLALYAGMKWMTAQGNEKDVSLARDTLINAAIGLVVIVAAYSLTNFIFTDVISTVLGTNSRSGAAAAAAGGGGAAAAKPAGVGADEGAQPATPLYCCYNKANEVLGEITTQELGPIQACASVYGMPPFDHLKNGACPK